MYKIILKSILIVLIILPILVIFFFPQLLISTGLTHYYKGSFYPFIVLIIIAILAFIGLSLTFKRNWLKITCLSIGSILLITCLITLPYFTNTGLKLKLSGLNQKTLIDQKFGYQFNLPEQAMLDIYSDFERNVFYRLRYLQPVERHIKINIPESRGFDVYVFKGELKIDEYYKVIDTGENDGWYLHSYQYRLKNGNYLEMNSYYENSEEFKQQIEFFDNFAHNNIKIIDQPNNEKAAIPVFISKISVEKFDLSVNTLIIAEAGITNNEINGVKILAYLNNSGQWQLMQNENYYVLKQDLANPPIEELIKNRIFDKVFIAKELPQGLTLADLNKAYSFDKKFVFLATDGQVIHLKLNLDGDNEKNYIYMMENDKINLINYFESFNQ